MVLIHVQAEIALLLIWLKGASCHKFPSLQIKPKEKKKIM